MSTRIEPRDMFSETLVIKHEECGHETQIVFGTGCAARDRVHYDKPECARCRSRREQTDGRVKS